MLYEREGSDWDIDRTYLCVGNHENRHLIRTPPSPPPLSLPRPIIIIIITERDTPQKPLQQWFFPLRAPVPNNERIALSYWELDGQN